MRKARLGYHPQDGPIAKVSSTNHPNPITKGQSGTALGRIRGVEPENAPEAPGKSEREASEGQ